MRAGVIARRTFTRLGHAFPALACVAAFLAGCGALFTQALLRGDGSSTPVAALWAVSAAPLLPVLATLLTARLVADERARGSIDLLLCAPVTPRDIVLGKFFGAWALTLLALALYLTIPLGVLPAFVPAARANLSVAGFLPAFGALALQSALWCACGLLASACCRAPAAAALLALTFIVALPQAAFQAALAWVPALRARLAEAPFSEHLVDFATGLVRLSAVAFYAALTCFALFAAARAVGCLRYAGRGGRAGRGWSALACLLAFVFACCAIAFCVRMDVTAELPLRDDAARFSARTRQILADAGARPVTVTCLLARKAPEFRAVSRLLRGLQASARASAGVDLRVKFVDPRWDLGDAARLVRAGLEEGTLEFRRGSRAVTLRVASLFGPAASGALTADETGVFVGESVCASALQRLALPAQRETVYWTRGHGERAFTSYDPVYGMSDIARDLLQDGYHLKELDLAQSPAVPGNCALIVVAGAREAFARMELQRLNGYLEAGGRLLVLAGGAPNAGAGPLVADWGVRQTPLTAVSPRTLTGADVLVTDFADHAVTRPLAGSTVLFEGACVLEPSLAPGTAAADRTKFAPLARTDAAAWGETDPAARPWTFDPEREKRGPLTLAAALERGGGVSSDLTIRPTRIVVIGDAAFVMNGALARRANANRDFFLNAVAWLAGLDAQTDVRTPGNVLVTGLSRDEWVRLGAWSLAPALLVFLGALAAFARGRRRL